MYKAVAILVASCAALVFVPQSAPAGATPAAVTAEVTAPDAPTLTESTVGDGRLAVAWAAPASDGGSPLTGYRVVLHRAGEPVSSTDVDATQHLEFFDGLANGSTYTVTVTAMNEVGDSPAAPSGNLVPRTYAPFASAAAFTTRQFRDFTDRVPTSTELASWTASLAEPGSAGDLVESLRATAYWQGAVGQVTRLYLAYFQRTPDTAGLGYWLGRLRSGTDISTVSQTFAKSGEFTARYGTLDNAGFVRLAYRNVLGREADAAGLAYWTGRLAAGRTRGWVMASLSDSGEHVRRRANTVTAVSLFYGMLRRTPSTGELGAVIEGLSTGNEVANMVEAILFVSVEYRARVTA